MSSHRKSATKKGSSMTSYYIRGKMIWLSYYVEGKRYLKSSGLKNTPENIKIVKTKIIPALDIKIATGEIYKKRPNTFEYYGEFYLKEKENNKSFIHKLSRFELVIDYFRGKSVDSITRLDIKQFLASLDMKSQSKRIYMSCVKEILEYAVDDGVIPSNPAVSIRLKADRKEPIQFYDREDVEKILSVAEGYIRLFLLIGYNTGMRVGEILGLQIGDFKDDGFIHIRRTRTKGIIGNGKNKNAIRCVPYSTSLFNEVKKMQSDSLFLFGDIDDATKLRRKWYAVIKKAGVKHKKLSSVRHTFATLMLKEKIVSINELAGLLGHSKPKITFEHYASVIDSKKVQLGQDFSLVSYNTATVFDEKQKQALK